MQAEKKLLQKLINISEKNSKKGNSTEPKFPKEERPVRVIFDTDLGTDIDDALALLMLLHLPQEDVEVSKSYNNSNKCFPTVEISLRSDGFN